MSSWSKVCIACVYSMQYLDIISKRYHNSVFVNSPVEPEGVRPVELAYSRVFREEEPFMSIVMPIHNQSAIIAKNLESILRMTTGNSYEMLLILDACSDSTESVVVSLFTSCVVPTLLTSVVVFRSPTPLFETACDNIGFLCSRGKYILEIQADMEMTELGYNRKLLTPFLQIPTVIGVSGRCCESFTFRDGVGKLGFRVEHPLHPSIDRGLFYIYETCNRGPLLLDREKVRQLGYLDERNYFLNYSEHDLFARAYAYRQWICGYRPIEFSSPMGDGTTRKERDELNTYWYSYRNSVCTGNGFLPEYCAKSSRRSLASVVMDDRLVV